MSSENAESPMAEEVEDSTASEDETLGSLNYDRDAETWPTTPATVIHMDANARAETAEDDDEDDDDDVELDDDDDDDEEVEEDDGDELDDDEDDHDNDHLHHHNDDDDINAKDAQNFTPIKMRTSSETNDTHNADTETTNHDHDYRYDDATPGRASKSTPIASSSYSSTTPIASATATPGNEDKKRKRRRVPQQKKQRAEIPTVKELEIPFRAIRRLMKVDKDIGTVQNEAAMVATYAVELFVEKIVNESNANAKKRGRNTVKYEDLAEVRASHRNLNFLDTLLP